MPKKYRRVAVGGTFDQLHKGQIRLIEEALKWGDTVVIGLTSDEMLKTNPKDHPVAKFDERLRALLNYLIRLHVLERVQIVPLNDVYGQSISDVKMDALVLSSEKSDRGEEINRIRHEKGLKQLKILKVEPVLAEDGQPISATRIRKGEIDREGHLLSKS